MAAGTTPEILPVTPRPKSPEGLPGVLARRSWEPASRPNFKGMDAQKRLRCVTIHHDGLKTPLRSSGLKASKARLDLIRRGHVDHNGWADIGYHFAIDRSGRIWECRSLAYQGAHVRGRNEGNIGILVMGNFDIESPSSAQLRALCGHVNAICLSQGISKKQVRTHREWASAATACPGRNLQPKVNTLRARNFRV